MFFSVIFASVRLYVIRFVLNKKKLGQRTTVDRQVLIYSVNHSRRRFVNDNNAAAYGVKMRNNGNEISGK